MVEVEEIERQISELWRRAGSKDAMRACTLNLVVPCEAAMEVGDALASFSEHHPCRAIVVAADPSCPAGALEAFVSAHCHLGPEGRPTCSEQVNLEAKGDAIELVPETVLQLLCCDLPVFTWWRRPVLGGDPLLAPLARLSDRVLADSSRFPDPASALAVLASLAADRSVRGDTGDLTWARLEPWRAMVASLFDAPSTRPLLDHVTSVTVVAGSPSSAEGFTTAAAYLVGWLGSRLGWRIEAGRVVPGGKGGTIQVSLAHDPALGRGEVGSVRIASGRNGLVAGVVAERLDPSGDLVRLRVEMERSGPRPHVLKLPARDEIALVCAEIDRDAKDPVFESALAWAARLGGCS